MNKKVLTYILLVVVIGIWGRIIYTSFFQFQDEEIIIAPQIEPEMLVQDDKAIEEIELIADYRDPFLGKRAKSKNVQPKRRLRKDVSKKNDQEKSEKSIKWPKIYYQGLVKNVNSKDKIAIVKIEEKQVLWKEGEEKSDLSMLRIYKDSILLSLETESKTFIKN